MYHRYPITFPLLGAHQPQSGSYSCEQPRPVPLLAQPPVAARSTHLATPRAISTPIRCRQCPPQVIEDQWAKSPTPWFFHSATAVHSRKNSSASRPSNMPNLCPRSMLRLRSKVSVYAGRSQPLVWHAESTRVTDRCRLLMLLVAFRYHHTAQALVDAIVRIAADDDAPSTDCPDDA